MRKIMSKKKFNYYLNKISWYSIYVDCFSRIISEMQTCGDYDYAPTDFPNMILLLEKYSKLLRKNVAEIEAIIELQKL